MLYSKNTLQCQIQNKKIDCTCGACEEYRIDIENDFKEQGMLYEYDLYIEKGDFNMSEKKDALDIFAEKIDTDAKWRREIRTQCCLSENVYFEDEKYICATCEEEITLDGAEFFELLNRDDLDVELETDDFDESVRIYNFYKMSDTVIIEAEYSWTSLKAENDEQKYGGFKRDFYPEISDESIVEDVFDQYIIEREE